MTRANKQRRCGLPVAGILCMAGALCMPFTAAASSLRSEQAIRNAMQMDQNAKRGQLLFLKNCAQCHGPQALGSAANLVPSLAGQRKAYLIKQLAAFTELDRESADMKKVMSHAAVADPQVWADIAGYLNGLQPLSAPETGDGTGAKFGESTFRGRCASCHGQDARGDDEGFVPSLRNQHYSYLITQMRSLGAGHRATVDEELIEFFDSLDTEELTAVADYLSRLSGPARDRTRMNPDGSLSR